MQVETMIGALLAFVAGFLIGKLFNRPVTVINENHTHIVNDDDGDDCYVPTGAGYDADGFDPDEDDDDSEDDWRG